MDVDLQAWLNDSFVEADVRTLPWAKHISYMPIDSVRQKIAGMEQRFCVTVNYFDLRFTAIVTPDKDTFFTTTIAVQIMDSKGMLIKSLAGSATFSKGQYEGNFQYGAIGKSLAIVNAFSTEFPQFGKGLNEREDTVQFMKEYVAPQKFETSKAVKALQKKL